MWGALQGRCALGSSSLRGAVGWDRTGGWWAEAEQDCVLRGQVVGCALPSGLAPLCCVPTVSPPSPQLCCCESQACAPLELLSPF